MITAVDHIHLVTGDVEGTIAFYTGTLGFTLHRRVRRLLEDGRPLDVTYLRLGSMLVELNRRGDSGANHSGAGNKPFGLLVEDIHKTVGDLQAKGVAITFGPREANTFGGLLAAFLDNEGREIELKEYRDDAQLNPDWRPSRPGVERVD